MNLRLNQYLEFQNRIAKINKIEGDEIKLRNFSHGNTKKGYSYQSTIKKASLINGMRIGNIKCISPEFIMELLLKKLKGGGD